jgi:hypothetical protein
MSLLVSFQGRIQSNIREVHTEHQQLTMHDAYEIAVYGMDTL